MKAKILNILFIVCVSFFLRESYVRAQVFNQDQQAVTMLTNFYTSYIKEYSYVTDSRTLELNIGNLRKKYCTEGLLSKINKDIEAGNLDFDPFLKAQDANPDAIKTLSIVADVNKANLYVVSYTDPYNKAKTSINLTVVMTVNGLKIDSVL